ncbi:MAG: hypothetical protein U0744_08515 [Gemmataceae bacterium]
MLFLDNQAADQRAHQRAKQDLAAKLATEIRVVPRPACGHISNTWSSWRDKVGSFGLEFSLFSLGAYVNVLKAHPIRRQWLLGLGMASLLLRVATIV